MDLKQIQYFLRAAELGHITKAAESLFITQSSLSKVINRLEESLGCKLFEKDGRNIRLSEAGKVVKYYAEKFEFLMSEMESVLTDLKSGAAGEVRIGCSFPSHEPRALMSTIYHYAMEHPDVAFHMYQMPPQQLETSLKQRNIDLAISSSPVIGQDIVWQEILTERMGIILSRNHPLAKKSSVSMSELKNERFFCNNANSDIHNLTAQFARAAGFEPKIHFEAELPEFIGRAISSGYGISIISRRGFHNSMSTNSHEWEQNITFLPLENDFCVRTCGLAYLENHYHNKAFQNFFQALIANFVAEGSAPVLNKPQ